MQRCQVATDATFFLNSTPFPPSGQLRLSGAQHSASASFSRRGLETYSVEILGNILRIDNAEWNDVSSPSHPINFFQLSTFTFEYLNKLISFVNDISVNQLYNQFNSILSNDK